MKKLLSIALLFCCAALTGTRSAAQTLTFSENFIQGTSNNCPQWTTFQNAINPGIYTGIRMYGTFDPVGLTCNDPVIANAMALAIKNSAAYLSPLSNGHTWSVCNRYQAEVWIDPPALCSGSNCPVGYLMRPCFGTTNFGGVNTNTCSPIPTQIMSIDLIAPPPCAQPTGVNATGVTTTNALLSWTPVSGSTGYEYVVDQVAASPTGTGTPTAGTSVPVAGLNINTTYYFHVRNKCTPILFSLWTNFAFTTADAYCKPPLNILFSNLTTNSVDILWSKMPTADYYQYKVDLTKNVPNASNYLTTTGISAHLSNLMPDTKYYVFVRSICLNGADSSTWKLDSFITKNYCGVPELVVASPGSLNTDVSWDPIPNAIAYEYRLSNYNLIPAFGTNVTTTLINVTIPNDGTDQYLHVRSKCNSQFLFSNWATVALRTTPTAVKQVQDLERSIGIYPNPVKDKFTILANETISGTYVVTDVTGKVLLQGQLAKNAEVNLGGFASGNYIFKYVVNSSTGIIKLVKE